ncbi:PTS sugar transporter subunit IIA [Candidatus Mycoplasma haematobovis]|uniref:PTS sugar transporter subunit IIA n=1 Tax=Candidatus Mycoplasma haematobovis TaxID=432608 RepID=A0A1A9QCH7_9MOLU|nr:PTS glucose transporter subunit IIA [Candidatus Mycoplasma haematobovis]OAL10282.1 PTS sugar transporter subunit IIA [Candidatus Mycoplasma haematobovis]
MFKNFFNKFKAKQEPPKPDFRVDVFSPCDGELVAQKDIPDEGFSEPHMGEGVGIKPSNSEIVSFMTGKLVTLFKTKHAYIIKDEDIGVSVMLHLGINTVEIPEELKAFTTNRSEGDNLEANTPLCEMNLEVVQQQEKSIVSALLAMKEDLNGKKVLIHKSLGEVKKGELIMSIVPA